MAQAEVCPLTRGRSHASAGGESRVDEFAAGNGGISARGISRGAEAAGAAAIEEALVASDSSVA